MLVLKFLEVEFYNFVVMVNLDFRWFNFILIFGGLFCICECVGKVFFLVLFVLCLG